MMKFEFSFALLITLLTALIVYAVSQSTNIEFTDLQLLSLFLHNLGFIFGTGGAVIVNAFNILLEKDEQLRRHKLSIASVPLKFVWVGLILMLIVHTGEVFSEASTVHIVKAIAIYPVLVGLTYITSSLIPKIRIHMPKLGEEPSKEFLSAKNQMKFIPLVLLAFWLLDFILNTVFEPKDAFEFLTK